MMIEATKYGFPYDFRLGASIAVATAWLSLQYNYTMFKASYDAAKDKMHALLCVIPYLQVNIMIILVS